jgi:ribonuclease HII
LLDDSKKLNEKLRNKLRLEIEEKALAFAVAFCNNIEIDKINILKASFLAMHRAIDNLNIEPQLLLIDGNRFTNYKKISHHCIIMGDGKFQAIAAASILAKTYRDEFMVNLGEDFPQYNWKKNKGYPTLDHRSAIQKFGTTPYHRMTFTLLPSQIQLF